jgi:putative ATP-binding cassette transporter
MPKAPSKSDPEQKAELAEIVANTDEQVEPPPPEVLDPDPQMSPEEAEQARARIIC